MKSGLFQRHSAVDSSELSCTMIIYAILIVVQILLMHVLVLIPIILGILALLADWQS